MNSNKELSIAAIVIGVIVTVVTVLLGTAGLAGYRIFSIREHNELRILTAMQADQAATALGPALWNFDRPQTEYIAESFMKDKRVHAVIVRSADPTDSMLAMVRDSLVRPVLTHQQVVTVGLLTQTKSVAYSGKTVGTVEVVVSPDHLAKQLGKVRFFIIFAVIAVAALLSIVLYILLWRIVISPVRKLEKFALQIESKTADASPMVNARFLGEFESLRQSITSMTALLESRYSELSEQAIRLQEDEAFRKRVFDSSRIPIVVMDVLTYRYIDCNEAAVKLPPPEAVA